MATPDTSQSLLTTRGAAAYLSVSERTVRTQVAAGKLPCIRIGRAVRFDQDDLRRFCQRQKRSA